MISNDFSKKRVDFLVGMMYNGTIQKRKQQKIPYIYGCCKTKNQKRDGLGHSFFVMEVCI